MIFATDAILTGAAFFLFGIAAAPLTPWAQTLRMEIIPEEMRGRAFALLRMLMQSGRPIGGAMTGFMLPAIGLAATVGLLGTAMAGAGLAGFLTRPLREAGRPS
jgi:MFS family permease